MSSMILILAFEVYGLIAEAVQAADRRSRRPRRTGSNRPRRYDYRNRPRVI